MAGENGPNILPVTDLALDDHGRPRPPLVASELDTLVGFLEFHRATLEWKTTGLTEAQLQRSLPPTTMTLGGLLKHLAFVEDYAPGGSSMFRSAVVTALVLAGLSLVGCASQPAAPASPSTSPSTTGPAAAATITAETFAHSDNHYLRNAADDVWCGVVTEPDGTAVVGRQVGFPIHDVPCTRGMPIYEFRAGVESDAQCTDDALFINPNAESVVLSDGQSVTIGTTTFTGERGGITLNGAPLEGGLHLSRLVGAQFAG